MSSPRPTAVPSWSAPRLRIVTPEGTIARFVRIDLPLADGATSMGRDATSTIRLPDPWMSRRHAMNAAERLVLEHQSFLRALARNIASTLPHHVDFDELVAFGQAGLTEAARSYEPGPGRALHHLRPRSCPRGHLRRVADDDMAPSRGTALHQ